MFIDIENVNFQMTVFFATWAIKLSESLEWCHLRQKSAPTLNL